MRKLLLALAGCFITIASYADLGDIIVSSYLNQNLNATVPINEPLQSIDLDAFKVELASLAKFKENGLSFNPELGSLNFKVYHDVKQAYVKISSTKPIGSPVLSFILHYKLNNNDFYRQYTILLDPIDYTNTNEINTAQSTSQTNKVIIVRNRSVKDNGPIPIYGKTVNAVPHSKQEIKRDVFIMDLDNPYVQTRIANFDKSTLNYITSSGDNLFDIARFEQSLFSRALLDINPIIIAIGLKNYRHIHDLTYKYESGVSINLPSPQEVRLIPLEMANEYLLNTSLSPSERLENLKSLATKFNNNLIIESADLFVISALNPSSSMPVKAPVKPVSKPILIANKEPSLMAFLLEMKWAILAIFALLASFMLAFKKLKTSRLGNNGIFALLNMKLKGLLSRKSNLSKAASHGKFQNDDSFFNQKPSDYAEPEALENIQNSLADIELSKLSESGIEESNSNAIAAGKSHSKEPLIDEELVATLEQILAYDSSRDDIRYKLFEIYLSANYLSKAHQIFQELDQNLEEDDELRASLTSLCQKFSYTPGVSSYTDQSNTSNLQQANSSGLEQKVESIIIGADPLFKPEMFSLNSYNTGSESLSIVPAAEESSVVASSKAEFATSTEESNRTLNFVQTETASLEIDNKEPVEFSKERILDFNFSPINEEQLTDNKKLDRNLDSSTQASGVGASNLDKQPLYYNNDIEQHNLDQGSSMLSSEYEEKLNLARMYYHIDEIAKSKEILQDMMDETSFPAEVVKQAQKLMADLGLNG